MYVQSIMETCGTWHSLVRKLGRCHDVEELATWKIRSLSLRLRVRRWRLLQEDSRLRARSTSGWWLACTCLRSPPCTPRFQVSYYFQLFFVFTCYHHSPPHGCQPVLVLGCWCLYCYLIYVSMIAGIFNTQLCIEWGYVTACCMYIVLSCPLLAWCSIVLILPVNPEFLYQLIL